MANLILGHGESGCFGTKLAPSDALRFQAAGGRVIDFTKEWLRDTRGDERPNTGCPNLQKIPGQLT